MMTEHRDSAISHWEAILKYTFSLMNHQRKW